MYDEMINMSKIFSDSKKLFLMRLVEEIEKAAIEVGYHESDDDEFMYDIEELHKQFEDKKTLQEILEISFAI